ncbi:MAG: hypothetical protein D3909_06540 [Candidatus Electrothrix sp. ATG1]|nr:hypothetical protein [Candidatus Electrothrix sp. ATG1]
MNGEKRERERQQASGYTVQFNENNLSYTGLVEDVSLKGLRVRICRINSQLMSGNTVSWFQGNLIRNVAEYMLAFSSEPPEINPGSIDKRRFTNEHFILTVRPRWRENKGNLARVGFNIISYPENWQKFVYQLLPMKNLSDSAPSCGSDSLKHLASPSCFFGRMHCPELNCCQRVNNGITGSSVQPSYDSLKAPQLYLA